ncbi:MAG: hypothetical protein ACR2PZ_17675 [Pseudomonadales bacterium]
MIKRLAAISNWLVGILVFAIASPALAELDLSLLHSIDPNFSKNSSSTAVAAPTQSAAGSRLKLNWDDVALTDAWQSTGARDETRLWQSAEAPAESGGTGAEDASADAIDPQCARFAADKNADIGDIIRAGCKPTIGQMSALMDNPLGNVAMLFNQFDSYRMENPANGEEAIQGNFMGIIQFPKRLNDNWNLINRIIYNVASAPIDQSDLDDFNPSTLPGSGLTPPSNGAPAPIDLFDGRTTNFGDTYYNGLFSPSEGIKMGEGTFLWGAGFDLGFPTAARDVLGGDKYTAGPSALGVYMGPKWKIGALVQQYWDYAGDSDASDVNLTNLQYFIFYSLNETTSIGAAPVVLANWEQSGSENVWTVPIGIGINKTFQFGKVPVRIGLEAFYSAIQPDDVIGSKWSWRFYVIPAVPSALFKWMN